MRLHLLFFAFILFQISSCETYKILIGETGNGKSYIANALGCLPTLVECSGGTQLCTQKTEICQNMPVIDSIGFDDYGNSHDIEFNGTTIHLSGFQYPLYDLFSLLSSKKISEAEFFIVYDANNMTRGNSSKSIVEFIKNDLRCPIHRVLNRYSKNITNLLLEDGDILVGENQHHLQLNGKVCSFSLSADWAENLINNNLTAMRSFINIEACNSYIQDISALKMTLKKKPTPLDTSKCQRAVVKQECTFRVIICLEYHRWIEYVPDEDCIARRDAKNNQIKKENEFILEEKKIANHLILLYNEKIIECKTKTANWDEMNPDFSNLVSNENIFEESNESQSSPPNTVYVHNDSGNGFASTFTFIFMIVVIFVLFPTIMWFALWKKARKEIHTEIQRRKFQLINNEA